MKNVIYLVIHALYKCDHSNFEIEYYFDFTLFPFILLVVLSS